MGPSSMAERGAAAGSVYPVRSAPGGWLLSARSNQRRAHPDMRRGSRPKPPNDDLAPNWQGRIIPRKPPAKSGSLHRRPERLRQRAILRIDGYGYALLPLRKDHRHADAAALFVELDRAREGPCRRPGCQVHPADRLGDLDLVGGTGQLQRLLQDPGVAVAAQAVLGQERL